MILTAIVAMTSDRVIGRDESLPWHLPEDLKFFKRTTNGHPIVMGRKTYDSIGRPLPKRTNIVLTRDTSWSAEGVTVIHSPEELNSLTLETDEIFIIGGSEIYKTFLPHLDSLIITHVHEDHQGDTRFPEFSHLFPHSEEMETHEAFTVKRHKKA